MADNKHQRWREISGYLDRALDLAGEARAAWLLELDRDAPSVSAAVRTLVDGHARLAAHPLLGSDATDGLLRALSGTGLAGQRLGAYTLESLLGHGGMGTVWLARRSDGRFEGPAAIKLLNASLLGLPAEQRFVREGSLLAKLRHPHIAQLIDAGVALGGQPYLVLEYVEGEPIDRYCRERNLDVEARVRLFLDVLAAVAHAHTHLVVHRDLKPSNIYVTPAGTVKLLDFGVAAMLGPGTSDLTREAGAGATPAYAAPEQLLGQAVTTATDVYALGMVLYVLLAGRHPFAADGKTGAALMQEAVERDLPRLSQTASDPRVARRLRGDLDNVVAKALKKAPAERYASAAALAEDLERFLRCEPVSARPDSFAYRTGKLLRRHRAATAGVAAIAAVLVGATAVTTTQMLEARRQRDAALYESKRAQFQAEFAYQIMSEIGDDGSPITIRELMEKGLEVLETSYADDPRFVIGMLINISGRFMDIGDTSGEYDALVRAERIARELGDPEQIAFVQCNTVETELAAGRPERAAERLRDGLANLAKVATPATQRSIVCGTAEARWLWSQGELDAAIGAATRVAVLMEAEDVTTAVEYMTICSMLQVMLREAGRLREAIEWNRREIAAAERAGREGTLSMAGMRHNRAAALYESGDAAAALELERSLVQSIVDQQGIDHVAPRFAHRLGLYQIRVEETDAGFVWLDRAIASAVAQNNRRDEIRGLLDRARARLILGDDDGALADAEAAEAAARENSLENQVVLRAARSVRAQTLLVRGEPSETLAEIERVLAEVGYPERRTADQLPAMLTLRARAELATRRNVEALGAAREALAAAEASALEPERSAVVGAALMALAEAARASADREAARASAQRAAAVLASSLGPEHSEARAARAFGCCDVP
jgi:serine/threonine-protein kinase